MARPQEKEDHPAGFWGHFYRASDLLEEGQASAAVDELDEALALQPDHPEASAMRAAALFKAERLEEAIDAYQSLIDANAGQPALYLNRALVLIKAERFDEAEHNLRAALDKGGDSKRLHGYLGLVYSKKSEYEKAIIAFNKAGARKMVAEMENMIDKRRQGVTDAPAEAPAAPAPSSAEKKLESQLDSEVKRTEEDLIDAAQRRRELLARRRSPAEVSAGAQPPKAKQEAPEKPQAPAPKPKPEPVAPPRKTAAPAPQAASVEVVPLVREDAPALLLETPGLLRIGLDEPCIARLTESAVVRGEVAPEPLYKRFRGQTTTTVFGSKDAPFCTVKGKGDLFLQAALGQTLYAIDTQPKEKAFISEGALCAFSGNLIWENGRIGSEKVGSIDLVTIYGEGTFVVSSAGAPTQMQVEDEDLLISHKTLIGWVGKFAPRVVAAPNGVPPEVGPMIRLKGTGRVLIGRL